MFPRHVLEFMIGGPGAEALSQGDEDAQAGLATSHQGVTILFMDIVGFTTMSKEVRRGTQFRSKGSLHHDEQGGTKADRLGFVGPTGGYKAVRGCGPTAIWPTPVSFSRPTAN